MADATERRPIPDLLETWRAAERRALDAAPGTAEAAEAATEVERARDAYREAIDAALRDAPTA